MRKYQIIVGTDGQTTFEIAGLIAYPRPSFCDLFFKETRVHNNHWTGAADGFEYTGPDYPQAGDVFNLNMYIPNT